MTELVDKLTKEARRLSPEERASLMEQLWDMLEPESHELPMPDWHREGLDQRLSEHDTDPSSAVPWEEARERLAARRRP